MKPFLAIARAQLTGRATTLVAALVVGFVPVVAALFSPTVAQLGPALLVCTWGVSQVIVLFLGIAVFGDDLASGRLAFFFARPVGPLTIWAARLGAALALAAAVEALLLAPSLLCWPVSWSFGGMRATIASFSMTPFQLATTCVLILAGGAVAGIVGRDRNLWLLVDAGAAAVVITAIVWSAVKAHDVGERLRQARRMLGHTPTPEQLRLGALERAFHDRADTVLWAVAVVAALAFLIATMAAVVHGRASSRRAHRAASIALWSTALPAAAGFFAYVHLYLIS